MLLLILPAPTKGKAKAPPAVGQRHFSRNVLEVDYLGMRVNVPTPEPYAVHKMVINRERGVKAAKDLRAVSRLWPLLDADAVGKVVASLSRKERARFLACQSENGLSGCFLRRRGAWQRAPPRRRAWRD